MGLEPLSPLAPLAPAGALAAAGYVPAASRDFAQLLAQARAAASAEAEAGAGASAGRLMVQRGDTLIGLVKAHHRQAGAPLTDAQAGQWAKEIAGRNGIRDADLIKVGQVIDFSALGLPGLAGRAQESAWPSAQAWASSRGAPAATVGRPQDAARLEALLAASPVSSGRGAAAHPVLERTLERAVQKGFVPAGDVDAVRQRIGRLAEEHSFSPDDFALMTLMESDGMNPQASNGRCHGIIQFCDGDGRGADSVGFGQSPRAILGLGVLQQLDLVDLYFKDVGLRQQAPNTRADDLYLSVLTPAARAEKRRDVPLNIAGPQAAYLYVDHNRQAGITRDSLLAGLHHNAGLRLGMDTRSVMQAQAMRAASTPVAALR